jgi:hypothetical protein
VNPRWQTGFRTWWQAILVGGCLGVPAVGAHPIHTSYTEAEYRPGAEKLELAVRLFTDDIEAALSRRAGKPVSFAKTPPAAIDAALLAYLRETLLVKSLNGTAQPLAWVGREFKEADQHLWVYLECPLPGGVEGARVRHRVLREIFSDQINSIRLREGHPEAESQRTPRQTTLLFTQDTEQRVTFR